MEHALKWPTGDRARTLTPLARRTLLVVLAFEAFGALYGGPALIAAPDGRFMQMPVEMLQGVFADFLIPGLLLTVPGVLNAVAFLVLLRRMPSAWLWVEVALWGFLVWFGVELAIVGAQHWAQAVGGIPVVLGLVAAVPQREQGSRPSSLPSKAEW